MDGQVNLGHSLPEEISNVVWRIVGNNELPLVPETTTRLIERTIRRRARRTPSSIQDQAISDVCGWFDFHEDKGWLRDHMREPVTSLVISGVKDALMTQNGIADRETAFCAIGSIEPSVAVNMICCSGLSKNSMCSSITRSRHLRRSAWRMPYSMRTAWNRLASAAPGTPWRLYRAERD